MRNSFILLILMLMMPACKKNHAPVVGSIECSPESRNAGTIFTLKATVSDEDGDMLNYLWKAAEGSFLSGITSDEVSWKSPVTGAGKTFTVIIVVSDGENEVTREINIVLEEPLMGNLEGQVNYTNFTIPIAEAIVKVGDKTVITDNQGHFAMTGIPAGSCVLSVTKEQFTVATSEIQIPVNKTLTVVVEITSVNNTTKLSGIVTDPDAKPLENARVVVYNPDGTESKLATYTNSAGYYRLWYIPFGNRTIGVTKSPTDDSRFIELNEDFIFQEIELQLNLTLQIVLLRGEFTDPRDHHVYEYKTIGELTWMIQNLTYLPQVSPSAKGSSQEAFYYVYGYQGTDTSAAKSTENYGKYGVLYNWPAAMKACPTGWHLPASDLEWDALIKGLGSNAGTKMKSVSGWADHGGGDNSCGFSAIPGGEVKSSGVFAEIDYNAYFWSSSKSSGIASYKGLLNWNKEVLSLNGSDRLGLSVRCVRDH